MEFLWDTKDALVNYKNYYIYADAIMNKEPLLEVYVTEIRTDNIDDHVDAIFAILKDGIESDDIHNLKVHVSWENASCSISIVDYWFSLIMWDMLLKTDQPIRPKHIFIGIKALDTIDPNSNSLFPWEVTRKYIKNYVNKLLI